MFERDPLERLLGPDYEVEHPALVEQVKDTPERDTPEKKIFKSDDRSSLLRWLAWFGVAFWSLFIIPVSLPKVVGLLFTAQPWQALKTLVSSVLATIVIFGAALINILIPFGRSTVASSFLPSFYYDKKDEFLAAQKKVTSGEEKISSISLEYKGKQYPTFSEVSVRTQNGSIDTTDLFFYLPADDKQEDRTTTSKYLIEFMPQGGFYQQSLWSMIKNRDKFNYNVRAFNYPGVGKLYPKPNHVYNNYDQFEFPAYSYLDLVNAGIAQIYQLAKKNQWTNEQIAKNVKLQGTSLGGAIALQVAAYFKTNYQIEIPIIIDRTFSSSRALVAGLLNKYSSIPTWYCKWLMPMLLFAGDDWDIDSIAAFKELGSSKVEYRNIGHSPYEIVEQEQKKRVVESRPKSSWRKIQELVGRPIEDADPIIRDGATLLEGLGGSLTHTSAKLDKAKNSDSQHLMYPSMRVLATDLQKYKKDVHSLPLSMMHDWPGFKQQNEDIKNNMEEKEFNQKVKKQLTIFDGIAERIKQFDGEEKSINPASAVNVSQQIRH